MKRLAFVPSLVALALFSASAAQAADLTVGHSGWNWGNPQPQGNTLRAVEFAGARGFAAGEFGTLLRTDDRGRSWTGIPTGTTAALTHIAIPDANTVVVGSGCVLRRSDDGGATFKAFSFSGGTGCENGIESLSFPSAEIGYLLLANGALLRTDDGGVSFTDRGAVPGTSSTAPTGTPDRPTDLLFTDANTGFAVVRGSAGGAVYRTTDGGATWFQRATSPQGLNGLHFPDPSIGYAVGSANTVLKTTDGGETWNQKSVPDSVPASELMSIRCATTATCLIASETGERVLRTGNGGNAFTAFSPAAQKIFAVSFSSASNAVAVGENGTTVLSTNADSGTPSFVPVADQALAGPFSRLRSGAGSLVLGPGAGGKLARSTDGGQHWSAVQVPTSEDLRDAWFVDKNTGFVLDSGGQVQRTMDGGDGWSELATGTSARPNALYAIDQNVVLLFGPKGVRRTTSGADPRFDPVDSKVASATALTDYDRTAGLALFAYGRAALIVSSDQGASWRAVNGPVKKPHYRRVDFLTGKLGYALLESGRLFRTRTGGKTWVELLGTGTTRGYDISFGDASNGYMSLDRFAGGGRSGWVLRTSDGGATWRPQLIASVPLVAGGIVAPDAATGFALAGTADLFYTGSGGDLGTVQSALTLTPGTRVVTRSRSVKIAGKVTPPAEGAVVTVLARNPKTRRWTVIAKPTVSATGTFTISHKVRHTTQYVAQWPGTAALTGDGSPVVSIVKKKR
ncbi:MAG: hypothetical protein QOJ57_1825 [Thermoleophilaceae bacterium]|nr:hypothetical protein [Thermoleophilaceae bacterium]